MISFSCVRGFIKDEDVSRCCCPGDSGSSGVCVCVWLCHFQCNLVCGDARLLRGGREGDIKVFNGLCKGLLWTDPSFECHPSLALKVLLS